MLLLPASLTAEEACDTMGLLRRALESEGEGDVVVDASPLRILDSAALAVLLEVQRLADAWGRAFSVRGAPDKLLALAKLYGVDVLLFKTSAGDQRRPAT